MWFLRTLQLSGKMLYFTFLITKIVLLWLQNNFYYLYYCNYYYCNCKDLTGLGIFCSDTPLSNTTRGSVRVWAWFNYNFNDSNTLEYAVRQVNEMSEADLLEVVDDDELIPQASARFGKGPVTFIEDHRIDQWPPNSRSLSPFSSIWSSVERIINNQPERDRPKNIDDV